MLVMVYMKFHVLLAIIGNVQTKKPSSFLCIPGTLLGFFDILPAFHDQELVTPVICLLYSN